MIEECEFVIVNNSLSFDRYLIEISKTRVIDHINKRKLIIYPKNNPPIYVMPICKLDMMDGFNKKINGFSVFLSLHDEYVNADKLNQWNMFVRHNNIRFK